MENYSLGIDPGGSRVKALAVDRSGIVAAKYFLWLFCILLLTRLCWVKSSRVVAECNPSYDKCYCSCRNKVDMDWGYRVIGPNSWNSYTRQETLSVEESYYLNGSNKLPRGSIFIRENGKTNNRDKRSSLSQLDLWLPFFFGSRKINFLYGRRFINSFSLRIVFA